MSKPKKSITRREFISSGIKAAGLVGLGSAIGFSVSRFPTNTTNKKPNSFKNVSEYDLTYDVSNFYEVDASLIQYKQAGKIKPKSQTIRGIAVGPDDRIYVAADKTVQVYGRDTARLSEIKLNGSPRCLTVTDDGTVYVGMKDRVEVYSPKGVHKANWDSLGQNAVFTSIAVSEKDVFVADAGNRVVLRYDASGKLVRRIGEKDEDRNVPGFAVPSPYFDLAVAPDGLLRVASPGRHRVEAYTFDGDFEFSWGKTSMAIDGFCGCCNPVNFALLPDGRFVTCEKGLPRVKIYDADGVFVDVIAGPESFAENWRICTLNGLSNCQTGGLDVAVDSQERVLVLDPIERVVRIFTQIKSA